VKILTVIGARPQFIKAAVVSRALAGRRGAEEILVHTGQHFDVLMSDVFFDEMGIAAPKYHLGIGGLAHGAMTGRMLEAIEKTLLEEKPDQVLVYGDTNSTLAGALAAAKLHVPVAHVEAGLRSFNMAMPEEINRRLTDHVCALLFAPTEAAVANLGRESITRGVHRTGDVMYDAALAFAAVAEARGDALARFGVRPKGYVLATVHRAENTDDASRLRNLFAAFGTVAADTPVLLPLHPRTRKRVAELGIEPAAGVRVVDPVGFLDMVMLEKHARAIATDSGGVQKEAYFYGVPCVTLREETEWVELVAAGANRLAPPVQPASVAVALREAIAGPARAVVPGLYGDGRAADAIAAILCGGA
jgi:UDP-GlcNAc3NAcA epimerase